VSRYTVRHNVSGLGRKPDVAPSVDRSGGWSGETWLGASAPGGLALPAAQPSMAWMYSPRGVFLGPDHLVAADSGNHRVLIWHGVPERDEQPADVVLGQPDGQSEGPAAGGRGPEQGMYLPTGVLVHDDRLVVADAWHHRILVWNSVPVHNDVPPDVVIGQTAPDAVEPNRGGGCSATSFYWPFGIAVIGDAFWVADTGNRRVLGWRSGIPEPDQPADGWCWASRISAAPRSGPTGRTPPTGSGFPTRPVWIHMTAPNGWPSPTPPTIGCCYGRARKAGPTVAARIMFWPSRISAPTAKTVGVRCNTTPCAGPMGCRFMVTDWRSRTRATTG